VLRRRGGFAGRDAFVLAPCPHSGPSPTRSLRGRILADGDAFDLDIEWSRPRGNIDEDAGQRVRWEVAGVDLVHRRECIDGSAVHLTLQHMLHRRARSFGAELHLLQDELGLTLDRSLLISPMPESNGGNPET